MIDFFGFFDDGSFGDGLRFHPITPTRITDTRINQGAKGPLGPGTFRRRTSVVTIPRGAASALAPYVDALARIEGFPVHGESALSRAGS